MLSQKDFTHIEFDVINLLSHDNIGMHNYAVNFLNNALRCDGYVSGGFAALLARHVIGLGPCNGVGLLSNLTLDNIKKSYIFSHIRLYLKTHIDDSRAIKNGKLDPLLRGGDIDIFFPENKLHFVEQLDHLASAIAQYRGQTPAGFGNEYRIKGTNIQCITKINGEPHEVLSTFDIVNAQVYFDKTGFYVTKEWLDLEDTRTLGINLFDRPNIVWRVHKWRSKHEYKNMRKEDHEQYLESIYNLAGRITTKRDETIDMYKLKRIIKQSFISLDTTNNLLLKASMLLDSYDQMHILKDRLKNND